MNCVAYISEDCTACNCRVSDKEKECSGFITDSSLDPWVKENGASAQQSKPVGTLNRDL